MDSKVTVVVPVYNIADDILSKCILSIINQSLYDIEIMIIDDGSAKECADLCDRLGALDKRISVFHKENGGVSTCRNYGIEKSNAEWIAFVDADDWLEPDYLQKLLCISIEQGTDITICDCIIEYGHKSVRNKFFSEDELNSDLCGKDRFSLQFLCSKIYGDGNSATDSGAPWGKLYRRTFIIDNNLRFHNDLRRMQDNVFNLEVYECAAKIFYFDEPLYHYRKSKASGFNKYNPYIGENYIAVFKYMEEYIRKYQKDGEFNRAVDYKVIFSMYVILKNDFCHPDNKTTYMEQRKKLKQILQSRYYIHAMRETDRKLLSFPEKILLLLMRCRALGMMKLSLSCKNTLYRCMGRGI